MPGTEESVPEQKQGQKAARLPVEDKRSQGKGHQPPELTNDPPPPLPDDPPKH
jgi:hypothetical protein